MPKYRRTTNTNKEIVVIVDLRLSPKINEIVKRIAKKRIRKKKGMVPIVDGSTK